MPEAVYRMMTLLCALVGPLPIGTNLGLLHLLWMLVSGRLLASRGALFPGLADCGLSERAVRRAWAALGQGGWTSGQLLARWAAPVARGGAVAAARARRLSPGRGRCDRVLAAAPARLPDDPLPPGGGEGAARDPRRPHRAGGPRRRAAPGAAAGLRARRPRRPRAQRPRAPAGARGGAAVRGRRRAGAGCRLRPGPAPGGRGDPLCGARWPRTPPSAGRRPRPTAGAGRPPTRGAVVRPLPRTYKGRPCPPPRRTASRPGARATPAARRGLGRPGAARRGRRQPHLRRGRHPRPAPSRAAAARHARSPCRARRPATATATAGRSSNCRSRPSRCSGPARQFVHAPETCQRLPELALLAGAVLSYAAATAPAIPTGFWDRRPRPTPGRLRRLLARTPFPHDFPLPARIREKAAVTGHLPTGFWGQRRPTDAPPEPPTLAAAA